MNSRDRIREYESRMRAVERELEEKQIKSIYSASIRQNQLELEERERLLREEEELRRLRDMQNGTLDDVPDFSAPPFSPYPYYAPPPDYEAALARQRAELEAERLAFLRENIRRQEEENRRLKEQYYWYHYSKNATAPTPEPKQEPAPAAEPVVPPKTEERIEETVVEQTVTEEPVAPVQPQPREETIVFVQSEPAPTAEPVREAAPEGELMPDGAVVFDSYGRPTFAEAYQTLSPKQKKYCDGLIKYACDQTGERLRESKYHVSVGCGSNQVLKLSVKNDTLTAGFRIEDERLRQLRLADSDTQIKTQETVVKVADDNAYKTAKSLVDLRIGQIAEQIAYQKQLRNERRRAKRESEKN